MSLAIAPANARFVGHDRSGLERFGRGRIYEIGETQPQCGPARGPVSGEEPSIEET
jgi:hypothetical protein